MNKINFRLRYTVALSLVALFSLLFYANTVLLIKDQAKYAEIIIEEHCKRTFRVQNSEKGALFEIALHPKQGGEHS